MYIERNGSVEISPLIEISFEFSPLIVYLFFLMVCIFPFFLIVLWDNRISILKGYVKKTPSFIVLHLNFKTSCEIHWSSEKCMFLGGKEPSWKTSLKIMWIKNETLWKQNQLGNSTFK